MKTTVWQVLTGLSFEQAAIPGWGWGSRGVARTVTFTAVIYTVANGFGVDRTT